MKFKHRQIVLDAADLDAESAFWAGLLDGTVEKGERWHNIWLDLDFALAVQLAPDHVPPDWPGGTPQQIHLDFYLEDLEAAHQKVLELGGRVLRADDDPVTPKGFRVYADPAGHPFCLCWLPPSSG
jgi:predicted enzyme related to lactoylglutathione lyase